MPPAGDAMVLVVVGFEFDENASVTTSSTNTKGNCMQGIRQLDEKHALLNLKRNDKVTDYAH